MGVNGLWTVVQPCARPTNLATLNRKRLAVDASIWIYQFLKAVRDKEGNALRNSHVVGFFRRICKLLWFGIQPVFIFDGGAPALKRATLQKRLRRREGRREDAVRTAGKLLAVQMQRHAEEEESRRKKSREGDFAVRERQALQEGAIPDASELVYVDEIGMSQKERQQTRKFHKQDAYHLPELDGGIASMGRPEDPRIMSVEELEDYARQFHNGEDVNLYDFSKIDFDGDFFKSLPPPDRYNILNAARLRSRLRMGLSKEQLDEMFPDRMAFSKFQIERVKERNHLTQRLMHEVGMTGLDLTLGVNARVAGEKDREYILVKNDGAEGGWALGVVSKEKDIGEAHKPIDVDAIQISYQAKDEDDGGEDEEFEDVPIEGINRLPKPSQSTVAGMQSYRDVDAHRERFFSDQKDEHVSQGNDAEDSLFVGGNLGETSIVLDDDGEERIHPEEEDDLNRAIALSLQNQHDISGKEEEGEEFEDVPMAEPEWTQRPAQDSRPIKASGSGLMIAHVVNNRANAAVPKRSEEQTRPAIDSDSDDDMQTVMARAKLTRAQPKPVLENKKNPFDGPLPFPKLSWGSSLFANRAHGNVVSTNQHDAEHKPEEDEDGGGGFGVEHYGGNDPKPLPPWLQDTTDIRESLKKQQDVEREINAEDKAEADENERLQQRDMRDRMIEIESSSEDGSDIEILEIPPSPKQPVELADADNDEGFEAEPEPQPSQPTSPEPEFEKVAPPAVLEAEGLSMAGAQDALESPEPEFEDVDSTEQTVGIGEPPELPDTNDNVPSHAEITDTLPQPTTQEENDLFADVEYDEFSDPGDEELLAQMAEEAGEHARFASELNKKSEQQNREDYENELRALRNQQKKDRRDADEVTQVMVTECQALLRLFGIPYITAPMEAEAQCAELVKLGIVDGIVTDDSDTFLFGGTRVYKNMFNSNKFVECYLGQDLEKELSLSRDELISLAQLLGSDYTDGLAGVGPVTAVEILSEFPGKSGLEDFRDWWTAVQSQSRPKDADAHSSFRRKFRKSQATKLFLPPGFPSPAVADAYLHPEVDDNTEPFQWGVPDLEGLRQFLMATIGWSKERTDEVLVPVIKDMNKRGVEGTQSNITRYFGGSVGVGAKDNFAPRQRVQGSKRMAAAVDKLRAKNASGGETADQEDGGSNKRRRMARLDVIDEDDNDN